MKSRLAMMAMLVSGLLLSGTGATLAVSNPADSAATIQYAPVQTVPPTPATPAPVQPVPATPATPAPAQNVLPEQTSGGAPEAATKPAPESGTAPADSQPATKEQGAAPSEQVAATGAPILPFTGFAAIPILLGGIALMAGGFVMRRRTSA